MHHWCNYLKHGANGAIMTIVRKIDDVIMLELYSEAVDEDLKFYFNKDEAKDLIAKLQNALVQ